MREAEKAAPSIMDAASAPLRLEILKLLNEKDTMPYTEIMMALKLDPIRDAGKFVYHLKSLIEAGLIIFEKSSKKYSITELGRMVVKFSQDIEEFIAVKKGQMFVRTSRFAIEEFDRDRITASLVREAAVPLELAQDIAAEAEERLLKLRTRYLTAPLIREFINAILIDKGLEEYRHKLTRLGMPLFDISNLFEEAGKRSLDVSGIEQRASYSVLSEYILLNGISRRVADEHLSGNIHINRLENWILRPDEIYLDARTIFKEGFLSDRPPKSLAEALNLLYKVYKHLLNEISNMVTFDYFNIFIAPYVTSSSENDIKKDLIYFIKNIAFFNRLSEPRLSLGIELIPQNLFHKALISPSEGNEMEEYYIDKISNFTRILIEAIYEVAKDTILLNPHFIFKFRKKNTHIIAQKDIITMIHKLAGDYGIPHITLIENDEKCCVESEGLKLVDDWTHDWRVDCFGTGNLGTVFVNLPRIAYEANGKDDRFFTLLDEVIKTAIDAFRSKKDNVEKRIKNRLLPALSLQKYQFFSIKNAASTLSFVGMYEAAKIHTGAAPHIDPDSASFAVKIIDKMSTWLKQHSEKEYTRLMLAQRPCEDGAIRLTKLDIERYGRETVADKNITDNSVYSDIPLLPLSQSVPIGKRLDYEGKFQQKLKNGCNAVLPINNISSINNLIDITDHCWEKGLRFITYLHPISYCNNCFLTLSNIVQICPRCESDQIEHINRTSGILKSTLHWSPPRILESKKWKYYDI